MILLARGWRHGPTMSAGLPAPTFVAIIVATLLAIAVAAGAPASATRLTVNSASLGAWSFTCPGLPATPPPYTFSCTPN